MKKKIQTIETAHTIVRTDFILAMINELDANAYKGDFNAFRLKDKYDADKWLTEHVTKLIEALMRNDPEKVREYAADVANCAMKIEECFGPQLDARK